MPGAILIFLLCPALWAQAQPAAAPSALARVEGRVVNSVTGEPLRKAQVNLRGTAGGEYAGTSDASGHFAIERIAPGSYTVIAQHQNFAATKFGATNSGLGGKSVNLAAGQSVSDIELKLVPFGVVSGKVVDQDGDPVAGMSVMVMHWTFVHGGRQLMPAGNGASTNDRGEFRIYNLAAGRYYLNARPTRYEVFGRDGAPSGPAPETYTTTYYPSALDASTAVPVSVSPGQEVQGADIRIRTTRTYTVKGKLAGFQPGHRYGINLMPLEASTSINMGIIRTGNVSPEDGTFSIRAVTPGRYALSVTADSKMGTRQEVTIGDGDLEGLVVAIVEPGTVKGKVLVEESGDNPPSVRGLRISLNPLSPVMMNSPNASSGPDGSFTMGDVTADRYKVNCSPIQGAYLKAIRWAGQPSNDGIVEMPAGGSPTLELVFAASKAVIDGDAKTADDQPATGATVVLMPASLRESDFRVTQVDQNGHFSAKGVAPGSYAALATDASIFSMPDAGLLKALEKVTTAVTVEENGHAAVALKMVPSSVIEAAQP